MVGEKRCLLVNSRHLTAHKQVSPSSESMNEIWVVVRIFGGVAQLDRGTIRGLYQLWLTLGYLLNPEVQGRIR
jgi:hypothetical protein